MGNEGQTRRYNQVGGSGVFPLGYIKRCGECYYAKAIGDGMASCGLGYWTSRSLERVDEGLEATNCPDYDPMDLCPHSRWEEKCGECGGEGDPED